MEIKKIEIKVSKASEFIPILESKKISYTIVDDKHINLYGDINLQKLLLAFSKEKLEVEKVTEKEETLENYYINLLGGDDND